MKHGELPRAIHDSGDRLGRPIVRTHAGPMPTDTLDIAELAFVGVSSEHELYPIDHVFDGRAGPGGSRWAADGPGAQTVFLHFRTPTDLGRLIIETEECGSTCSLQIDVSGWSADERRRFELERRELRFSPYGPSFHRESWVLSERGVTQLSIRVTPAPPERVASLTAITLR